ncbi:hypothetical protein [Neisseria montereyensis]|uniref:Uncharacterized protein n=1 Tax=Neisseria montereyensis TaxID=2973938 RepID=A0ABT2FAF7_9NEIS|nr:hypothetical protein [Neisseria montereyensis]MCS4532925.1 hypothetical protein [Neisseria montereyensis]
MTDNSLILYTTSDGQAQFTLRELGGQLWLKASYQKVQLSTYS